MPRDLLDDLLLPDPEPEADPTGGIDPEELKELQALVQANEKEKQGLLKAVKEERSKRQEMGGRLDQITNTLNSMLDQRETLIQSQNQKDEATLKGIPVEYDDDGDGYINADNRLQEMISPHEEKVAALEKELAATRAAVAAQNEYNETVNALIGENEAYEPAHRQYKTARKWISDKVADWSVQNGWRGTMDSKEALTHVIDEQFEEEFATRFPGMDAFTVTIAEDSPKHFRRMLAQTAKALGDVQPAPKDSRFQRVINKPSSLGKSANAGAEKTSLSERMGSLSATDLLSFGDAEIEALTNHLRKEEQKDGIDW
jgi:hypothetical protein